MPQVNFTCKIRGSNPEVVILRGLFLTTTPDLRVSLTNLPIRIPSQRPKMKYYIFSQEILCIVV